MRRYEGIKREYSAVYCPRCKKEIGFADMTCPHCGADARTDPRGGYKPRLSSSDIQPGPKRREGGPHEPTGNYSFGAIGIIGAVLKICAVVLAVALGIIVGNLTSEVFMGILTGIFTGIVFLTVACAVSIQLKNTAMSAHHSERIALGLEYQIEQCNEIITIYNKDKSIEADNAEVFAKLLSKISKMAEAQKNTLIELTNIVGAISRKLNKNAERMTLNEVIEEIDFDDDFDEEAEASSEPEAEPQPETADVPEEVEVEEKEENLVLIEKSESESGEEEENSEEEPALEEKPEESESEEVEETEAEEPAPEEEPEEKPEEKELSVIECPYCGADIKYDEDELEDDGTILITCEECQADIAIEVVDEDAETEEKPEEKSDSEDAESAYKRAFGNDEPVASSSLTSRLDALLDDEDDED